MPDLTGTRHSLDIDLLRTFVLIAEESSFTRAAERVGRSQSAVSLQVKRLEALVGRRLVERAKGTGVRLTEQGNYLLHRAQELLSLNDEILSSARNGVRRRNPSIAYGRRAADPPSIVVLPFRVVSSDANADVLAASVVESIVVYLSAVSWLVVVSRDVTIRNAGRAIDVRQVGRELNARYALQGSFHRAGARVSITVQLLEVETQRHLWGNTRDGTLDDVFDLRENVAQQVVAILEPMLRRFETERLLDRSMNSLDALGLYQRAFPHVVAQMPEEASKALPLLRLALERDPDYAPAHALLAWCHELCFARGGLRKDDREAALVHARAAIASDPSDGTAVAIAGFVISMLTKDSEGALSTMELGLAMNPSSAAVSYLCAQANAMVGRRQPAMAFADQALRLSPTDAFAFQAHMALGETALQEERFSDAASCFARAALNKPNFSSAYIYQAIALAQVGRSAQASIRLARGFELEPGFNPRAFYEHDLAEPLRVALVDGARRLGLPA